MDTDHPELDQRWDTSVRSESGAERLDRNWNSLPQELRVTQTGVQLLMVCSLSATVVLAAPVGIHRLLFRRHRIKTVVSATHRCAYLGLLLLGAALVGVAGVVFGTVLGSTAAIVAGLVTAGAIAGAWVVLQLRLRSTSTPVAQQRGV